MAESARFRLRNLLRLPRRAVRFVRQLFGGPEGAEGVGVREPRRPLAPTLSGAATVELPADDSDDA